MQVFSGAQDAGECEENVFALITFGCVWAVAFRDLVDRDCVDVACCTGYAESLCWDINGSSADAFNNEHPDHISWCLAETEVENDSFSWRKSNRKEEERLKSELEYWTYSIQELNPGFEKAQSLW